MNRAEFIEPFSRAESQKQQQQQQQQQPAKRKLQHDKLINAYQILKHLSDVSSHVCKTCRFIKSRY